jgi:hypothetical protein
MIGTRLLAALAILNLAFLLADVLYNVLGGLLDVVTGR